MLENWMDSIMPENSYAVIAEFKAGMLDSTDIKW